MLVIFNNVISIFAIIFLGYLLVKKKVIRIESLQDLKKLLVNFILPCLMFRSITQADIGGFNLLSLYGTYYAAILIVYILYMCVAIKILKSNLAEAATGAMGATFSNGMFMAFSLVTVFWGDSGVSILFIIIFIHAAVLWVLTVTIIEVYKGDGNKSIFKIVLLGILRTIKEPIVIGIIVSLVFRALSIETPKAIGLSLDILIKMSAPLALLVLGGEMTLFKLRGNLFHAFVTVAFKNIALPILVFIFGYYLFELPNEVVKVSTVMAACPMGINPYILATKYNIDVKKQASSFLLTNLVAIFSLTIVLILLDYI